MSFGLYVGLVSVSDGTEIGWRSKEDGCRTFVPSGLRKGPKVVLREGEETDGNPESGFRSRSTTEGIISFEPYLPGAK